MEACLASTQKQRRLWCPLPPCLFGQLAEQHPLAADTFRALVGLVPRRMYRRQPWSLIDEPARAEALYEAASLEATYSDRETVAQLAAVAVRAPAGPRDLLDRLWTTRAARFHPLDADFLDAALRPMPVAARDLRWTEWVRRSQEDVIKDLQRLEQRWRTQQTRDAGEWLRARWVMWP